MNYSVGTVYVAAADGFLVVIPYLGCGSWSYHYVLTGPTAGSMQLTGWGHAFDNGGSLATTTVPIAEGQYFEVINELGCNPYSITFYSMS